MTKLTEPLIMGVITAVAALAVLSLIDGPNLAAIISAVVAGLIAFGVTFYQVRHKR